MGDRHDYRWISISADSSEIEVETFMDAQKMWKKKYSQHDPCMVCPVRYVEHTMQYIIYKCASATCASTAHATCEWFVRTQVCDLSKRGSIEQSGLHVSCLPDPPNAKLNFTMKRFIRGKVEERYKPSRILNAMIDALLIVGNGADFLKPVQGYAQRYRTTVLRDNNDVDEMEALLRSRPFQPELPEDTAFAYAYETDVSGKPKLSKGSAQKPVVIGFSSKKMMRNLAYADQYELHIDATFKLNTASFPSFVIGVSDARRQFHPVAFFIVSDIRQQQLELALRETFTMYQAITGKVVHVGYVMGDADKAQRNAIEAVIDNHLHQAVPPVFLMCFFHVMQNVRKYITSVSVGLRPRVFKHVYRIHYARSITEVDRRVVEAVVELKNEPGLRDFERRFSEQ